MAPNVGHKLLDELSKTSIMTKEGWHDCTQYEELTVPL